MKKIISMLVAMLMVIALVPTLTMASTGENILLSHENFNVPAYTNGGHISDPWDAQNELFATSFYINQNGDVNYSTAKVYIEQAGTYNLWILSGYAAGTDARCAKVGFDDQGMQNATPHKDHAWDKTEWTLTAGWHELKVGIVASWNPVYVNALYITNNLTYTPDVTTDNELLAYNNTTAPVFEENAVVETSLVNGVFNVKFPAATDDNDVIYEYTAGGTTTSIENIAQPVAVSGVVGTAEIVLIASDKWGNSTEKTFTVTAPEAPALPESERILLNGENFNIPAYANGGYIDNGGTALNTLFAKSIKISALGNTDYSTARVYIAKEGTYNLWVLSANEVAGLTDRYAKVGFDSETMQNVNPHKDHAWDKTEWTLTAGWHDLKVGICDAWKNTLVNALYITDDLTYVPNTATDDELLTYHNTTAPVFEESAVIETSLVNGVLNVKFPVATDDNDVIYEYTAGGTTTSIENIAQPVEVSGVVGTAEIVLIASDKWGNSIEKTFTVAAPEAPALPESEHILLNGDNFNVPAYTGGGYIDNGGTALNTLFAKSIKISANGNANYSVGKVYIAQEGTYNLWVLSANEVESLTDRYAKVGFDNETMKNVNPHKDHKWDKTEWTLTKGWHDVKVGICDAWKNTLVNALYITNDLTYVPDTATDDKLLTYHNTTAPVFEESAVIETSFANGVLSVKFPEATDDNDVMYKYTVSGTTTAIEDITQPVAVSGVADTTEVILTASDKWGNSAEKAFTVTAPRTKWTLTWNNFVKPEYSSWTYSAESSLVNTSINPNTLSTDRTGSTSARAKAYFYVEASGKYAVYMLSKPTAANRIPKMWVNGVAAESAAFHTDATWKWDKVVEMDLSAGWNNVEFSLNAEWQPFHFNALYITNDLTEVISTDNDDALLVYGDSSVNINGERYMACSLENVGYVVNDLSINITPVKGAATATDATVSVNGVDAAWDIAATVTLNQGINTITVDSSDDSADCTFKVASTGAIINHIDAEVTGKVESAYVGADGSNSISLEADGSAKFSAQGISGTTEVWAYVIAATEDEIAATDALVTIVTETGTSTASYSNKGTASAWVKLGEYYFTGNGSEYVEIAGKADANVYVDSIKFVRAGEYVVSAPVTVEADGKIKFVYECYKKTDSASVPVAIIAEYGGIALSGVSVNEVKHNAAGVYTISTKELDKVDGKEYRSFIWDSFFNMTPLR